VSSRFFVSRTEVVGESDAIILVLNIENTHLNLTTLNALHTAAADTCSQLWIIVIINSPYLQGDTISNVVDGMVIWQPCLSVFDQNVPYFVGDMMISLTPY